MAASGTIYYIPCCLRLHLLLPQLLWHPEELLLHPEVEGGVHDKRIEHAHLRAKRKPYPAGIEKALFVNAKNTKIMICRPSGRPHWWPTGLHLWKPSGEAALAANLIAASQTNVGRPLER